MDPKVTAKSGNNFFFLFFLFIFLKDKSCNLFNFVSVLLSASVERVGVSRMRDFFLIFFNDGLSMNVFPFTSTRFFEHCIVQRPLRYSLHSFKILQLHNSRSSCLADTYKQAQNCNNNILS